MARKNVTLSLEEAVYEKYQEYCTKNAIALSRYEKYQEYCTKNAIALSRSIELYMEKKLKEEKNE